MYIEMHFVCKQLCIHKLAIKPACVYFGFNLRIQINYHTYISDVIYVNALVYTYVATKHGC